MTTALKNKKLNFVGKESPPMVLLCSNRGHTLEDNFCARCGQRKYRRIDKNYILGEIQNVFSATGGFLFTMRKLVVNPGKTAREFIDGKRIKHFLPLYFVFVLSGFDAKSTNFTSAFFKI